MHYTMCETVMLHLHDFRDLGLLRTVKNIDKYSWVEHRHTEKAGVGCTDRFVGETVKFQKSDMLVIQSCIERQSYCIQLNQGGGIFGIEVYQEQGFS